MTGDKYVHFGRQSSLLSSLLLKSAYIETSHKAIGLAEQRLPTRPRGSMFKPRLVRYIVLELFLLSRSARAQM